jgi:hypothetical protein
MEQKQSMDILEEAKSHYKPRVSLIQMAESKGEKINKPEQSKSAPMPDIDVNIKKLITLTITVPFRSTSEYYDLLDLNYREGNEAKTIAMQKNFLVSHDYHLGKRGGKVVLLEPTGTAFALLKLPPEYEHPKFLHKFLQHQVKKSMTAKGFKATIEKGIKGKNIDVVVENKEREILGVEIAMTDKDNERINVYKDLFQAGCKKLVIIAKDKDILNSVKKKISASFDSDVLSKVSFCLLPEFTDQENPFSS